jgi:apolipoprotein N-acyltransferase
VPGDESSVWQGDGVMFGYLICFDSIYDSLARESVRNGAEIIMISTNDSWFGDSVGTRMHSAQAKLRAVENGRSVVRAANTGISSVITPDGETLALIPADEEGQICVNVPVSDNMTLYTKIGNLFAYICIIFGFFCMFLLKSGTKTLSYRLKR